MAADVDAWTQAYFHTWHAHDPSRGETAAPHTAPTHALAQALYHAGPVLMVAHGPAADAARLMAPWYAHYSGHELRVLGLAELQALGVAPFRWAGLMLIVDPHFSDPEAASARALARAMACPTGTLYAAGVRLPQALSALDQAVCHLVAPDGALDGARWLAWLWQLAAAHAQGASPWGQALPALQPPKKMLGLPAETCALVGAMAQLAQCSSLLVWYEPQTVNLAEPLARRLQRAGFAVTLNACVAQEHAVMRPDAGHLVLAGPSTHATSLIAQLERRGPPRMVLCHAHTSGAQPCGSAHLWPLPEGPHAAVVAWAAAEALCRLRG